ncbi:MAG: glycosyltransferase [Sphaerochaetaceae bacterium]|nr:glycosyltransferase [Sphaerochaetaceae bacterium]
MKIIHCCLAAFYIDGYGYQENILPREHKKLGFEVNILASTEIFINNNSLGYTTPKEYINEDNIQVTRLGYKKFLPHFIMKKLRIYSGTYDYFKEHTPDIIFLHDIQFLDILQIKRYVKNNPKVQIFVDCHTDFKNSAKNWVSKNIMHRIIYRFCAKQIEPYTTKFWGVLPARVDFLIEMYHINPSKVDLLVMGAEEKLIKEAKNSKLKDSIYLKYNLLDSNFLIITGGKIDYNKLEVLTLMNAVKLLNNKNIKLIIFGSVAKNLLETFKSLLSESIIYIGWVDSKDIYKIFELGDLIVFPGLHSVLWEQAVGQGKPCIFKHIKGFEHIDLCGNCQFLYTNTKEEIMEKINLLTEDKDKYKEMKKIAEKFGKKTFSYTTIAKKSIKF